MYYFAYGSNLSHEQMKKRCPTSKFVGKAELKDYTLIFCGYSPRWKSGVANIVPAKGGIVYGAIYSLSTEDLAILDGLENSQGYQRFEITVTSDGDSFNVHAYKSADDEASAPSAAYLETMHAGIEKCGLEENSGSIFGSLASL